jgi:enamine deaminase RidA (YjgF/YER057c/UK114 family)
MTDIYHRLDQLGIMLPKAPAPIANFETHRIAGPLLFLSGQGPLDADGHLHRGKVGSELTVQDAYGHARLTGINLIAVMHEALGDLNRIAGIVKLLGMVNADPDFDDHPKVINGCSDLLIQVFGDRGRHARSAVGMGSLPGRISVEIEAVVEFER